MILEAHVSHAGTHGTEQTESDHWIEWACREAETGSLLEWAGFELMKGTKIITTKQ